MSRVTFNIRALGLVTALLPWTLAMAWAQDAPAPVGAPSGEAGAVASEPAPAPQQRFNINEYRVEGAKLLPSIEVERAVYPYLGPGRTETHVEGARAALEEAYRAKGYQTVRVNVPEQTVRGGIIRLQVVEMPVGRLRVNNSRYHLLSRIKRRAKSMAPGNVPNWDDVQRDMIALNNTADLRVTPALAEGLEPGTVDIDLNVEDTLPLHGSLELNNRYSPDTTELRLNGALSYSNLWQAGHTLGGSFQIAPQRLDDASVYSAFYLMPVPGAEGVALFGQYTHQDSDVSTLGGSGVLGRGDVYSARIMFTLPGKERFYHNLAFGIDYKDFTEDVTFGGELFQTPITYYPVSLLYTATWLEDKSETEVSAGVNWHFRGCGSEPIEFDNKRYNADGGFFYLRGEVSHLQKLPADVHLFGKVQGQLADRPLINNEQYSGGGLSNARGYLESTALGDNAIFGTFEVRSPSFLGDGKADGPHEWRVYAFADAGLLTLNDALPEQEDQFELASVGAGTLFRLWDHFHGSLDLGFPLTSVGTVSSGDPLLTFRLWAEF